MINLEELKSLSEVLEKATAQGDRVNVILDGGQSYSGKVKKNDANFYSIIEISGKEFYDVMFRLDKVIAIEVRARDH